MFSYADLVDYIYWVETIRFLPQHRDEPTMVRKASKSRPTGVETAAGRETITKSEAVRRALADGAEQPSAGVAYIKSRFGLEIGPQHFSAVKAAEKKKAGTVLSRGRRKPGRRPYAVRPASSHAKPANGD